MCQFCYEKTIWKRFIATIFNKSRSWCKKCDLFITKSFCGYPMVLLQIQQILRTFLACLSRINLSTSVFRFFETCINFYETAYFVHLARTKARFSWRQESDSYKEHKNVYLKIPGKISWLRHIVLTLLKSKA